MHMDLNLSVLALVPAQELGPVCRWEAEAESSQPLMLSNLLAFSLPQLRTHMYKNTAEYFTATHTQLFHKHTPHKTTRAHTHTHTVADLEDLGARDPPRMVSDSSPSGAKA